MYNSVGITSPSFFLLGLAAVAQEKMVKAHHDNYDMTVLVFSSFCLWLEVY